MTSDSPLLSTIHVGWKFGRRSSSTALRSVYIVAVGHFSYLINIFIINILLRGVYHTRHRTVRTALTSTDGRTDTGMRFNYTFRNNMNIQFASRETLHIFTLWGGTAGIRSRCHEGVAHLNSVQGISSLNRWPHSAKGTDDRSIRKRCDA